MIRNDEELNKRLNFINDAKKTNIAKINVNSIENARIKPKTLPLEKVYVFGIH